MNDKTLGILGGLAVVLLIATYFVGTAEKTVELPFEPGQRLLEQGVDVDKIAKIEIQKGDDQITLQREGGQFRIAQKSEYPARRTQVDQLLRNVDGIICESLVTSDEANYADLEGSIERDNQTYKADITGANEICTEVRFLSAEGNEMTKVLVTEPMQVEGDDGPVQYCRVVGDPNVYRLDQDAGGQFRVAMDPIQWIDTFVLRTRATEIDQVAVTPREGEAYVIRHEENTIQPASPKPVLVDVPEGMRQLTPVVRTTIGASNAFRFEDVLPASELGSDFEFGFSHTVTHNDERITRIEIGTDAEGAYWARTSAEFGGKPPVQPSQGAGQEELMAYRTAFEEMRRVRDDAAQYSALHRGWAYKLPKLLGDRFTNPRSLLIEEGMPRPDQITASHILISWQGSGASKPDITRTKEEALTLAKDLFAQVSEDPSLFEELARENSDDGSAAQGGSLGDPFTFEKMVKPFSEAAFDLEVGKIAEEIVESQFGYHIIRRDS